MGFRNRREIDLPIAGQLLRAGDERLKHDHVEFAAEAGPMALEDIMVAVGVPQVETSPKKRNTLLSASRDGYARVAIETDDDVWFAAFEAWAAGKTIDDIIAERDRVRLSTGRVEAAPFEAPSR